MAVNQTTGMMQTGPKGQDSPSLPETLGQLPEQSHGQEPTVADVDKYQDFTQECVDPDVSYFETFPPKMMKWLPECQRLSGQHGIEMRLQHLTPVLMVNCDGIIDPDSNPQCSSTLTHGQAPTLGKRKFVPNYNFLNDGKVMLVHPVSQESDHSHREQRGLIDFEQMAFSVRREGTVDSEVENSLSSFVWGSSDGSESSLELEHQNTDLQDTDSGEKCMNLKKGKIKANIVEDEFSASINASKNQIDPGSCMDVDQPLGMDQQPNIEKPLTADQIIDTGLPNRPSDSDLPHKNVLASSETGRSLRKMKRVNYRETRIINSSSDSKKETSSSLTKLFDDKGSERNKTKDSNCSNVSNCKENLVNMTHQKHGPKESEVEHLTVDTPEGSKVKRKPMPAKKIQKELASLFNTDNAQFECVPITEFRNMRKRKPVNYNCNKSTQLSSLNKGMTDSEVNKEKPEKCNGLTEYSDVTAQFSGIRIDVDSTGQKQSHFSAMQTAGTSYFLEDNVGANSKEEEKQLKHSPSVGHDVKQVYKVLVTGDKMSNNVSDTIAGMFEISQPATGPSLRKRPKVNYMGTKISRFGMETKEKTDNKKLDVHISECRHAESVPDTTMSKTGTVCDRETIDARTIKDRECQVSVITENSVNVVVQKETRTNLEQSEKMELRNLCSSSLPTIEDVPIIPSRNLRKREIVKYTGTRIEQFGMDSETAKKKTEKKLGRKDAKNCSPDRGFNVLNNESGKKKVEKKIDKENAKQGNLDGDSATVMIGDVNPNIGAPCDFIATLCMDRVTENQLKENSDHELETFTDTLEKVNCLEGTDKSCCLESEPVTKASHMKQKKIVAFFQKVKTDTSSQSKMNEKSLTQDRCSVNKTNHFALDHHANQVHKIEVEPSDNNYVRKQCLERNKIIDDQDSEQQVEAENTSDNGYGSSCTPLETDRSIGNDDVGIGQETIGDTEAAGNEGADSYCVPQTQENEDDDYGKTVSASRSKVDAGKSVLERSGIEVGQYDPNVNDDKVEASQTGLDTAKHQGHSSQSVSTSLKLVENGDRGELEKVPDVIEGKLCVGTVVWGKFGKEKWWPGIMIDGTAARRATKPGFRWLYWFSDKQISQVKERYIENLQTNFLSRAKQANSKMKPGILKALEVCAERAGVDLSGYTDVEDWATADGGFLTMAWDNPKVFAPDKDCALPQYVLDDLKEYHDHDQTDCSGRDPSIMKTNKTTSTLKGRTISKPVSVITKLSKSLREVNNSSVCVEEGEETCFVCSHWNKSGFNHPLFDVKICKKCKENLKSSFYAVDDDGCSMFCCVCGDGGKLFVCDNSECARAYCFDCVEKHTSPAAFKKVRDACQWKCYICTDYTMCSHGRLVVRQDWNMEVVKFFQAWNKPLCDDLGYMTTGRKRKLRVLSLYDGIGTGKVALDQLGLETDVYYASEINEDAMSVASFHHGVTHLGDAWNINKQKLSELCPIDLVLGGPPCNDLSIVNPDRKGFDGSGILVMKFILLLRDIEDLCHGRNHVFWLMENTGHMITEYKNIICNMLGMEPALWDSKYFTGQRRARYFWGNIPGIYSTPEFCKQLEKERKDLDHALITNCNRKALVSHTRTITCSNNSLTITNGKPNHVVSMNGVADQIWIQELERLFGFPAHYTDVGQLTHTRRRKLLGKAWSVPVIKHLLSPLTAYFKVKDTAGQT